MTVPIISNGLLCKYLYLYLFLYLYTCICICIFVFICICIFSSLLLLSGDSAYNIKWALCRRNGQGSVHLFNLPLHLLTQNLLDDSTYVGSTIIWPLLSPFSHLSLGGHCVRPKEKDLHTPVKNFK